MRDREEGERGQWMEVERVEEGKWEWRGGKRGLWAD